MVSAVKQLQDHESISHMLRINIFKDLNSHEHYHFRTFLAFLVITWICFDVFDIDHYQIFSRILLRVNKMLGPNAITNPSYLILSFPILS
jgi:hypothetical protein